MSKLHLFQVHPGSHSSEEHLVEKFKGLNNGIIEIKPDKIVVRRRDGAVFTTPISKLEQDFMSETFKGHTENGTPFRIVFSPGDMARIQAGMEIKNSVFFGSLSPDGYALGYNLVHATAPDMGGPQASSDSIDKISLLVVSALTVASTDLIKAKEYLERALRLIEADPLEMFRIQNVDLLMRMFHHSIEWGVRPEKDVWGIVSVLHVKFDSPDHLRHEHGMHVGGPYGGANRRIGIVPNYDKQDGFLVTVYNMDGVHPVWNNNVQMATKEMKLVSCSADEIHLRGDGKDQLGNSFEDYALSLHLSGSKLDHIRLYMLDRGIELKYLGSIG